ncbi:MAG: hypothetical protein ABI877_07180 [Gemmatimonadaceae bacterium]
MTTRTLLLGIPFALMGAACRVGDAEVSGGDVSIAIQQSLTGETTSAGTFTITGALSDDGPTTEELTFGGPLTQSPVPVTFRRTLTGRNGTIVITGSASLAFTSPIAATLSGTWQVESATGAYARGRGTLTGAANFGATPPTANLTYTGSLTR